MLTPDEVNGYAGLMAAPWDELNERILRDMVRRIVKAGKITSTAEWQSFRAQALGASRAYLLQQMQAIVQELGDRMVVSRTDIQHTLRGLTPGAVPKSPSQREHDAVIAMLLDGATVDPAAEQALAVARIVDGIYRSASTGCGISF